MLHKYSSQVGLLTAGLLHCTLHLRVRLNM